MKDGSWALKQKKPEIHFDKTIIRSKTALHYSEHYSHFLSYKLMFCVIRMHYILAYVMSQIQ